MECISFDRYCKAFKVLEHYSQEYPFMLNHLLHFVEVTYPAGISMLDIGAGTGGFFRSFAEKSTVPIQKYVALEPSPDHINLLKDNLKDIPVPIEIRTDYFTPQITFNSTFDLILLSHSCYWFLPDPEPYLINAFRYLNERGKAVIYQGNPSNFCYILNLIFDDILPKERNQGPKCTSWVIRDILEKNHIPHTVTYLPGYLYAEETFKPDNQSKLNDLITFSLMVDAESLDLRIIKRIEEIIQNISYPSENGRLLYLGVDAIIVDNPNSL